MRINLINILIFFLLFVGSNLYANNNNKANKLFSEFYGNTNNQITKEYALLIKYIDKSKKNIPEFMNWIFK